MGLLDGRKGLVFGIANDRSIASHIAKAFLAEGAQCGFPYLPGEKNERRVQKALEDTGIASPWLMPCDVSKDADLDATTVNGDVEARSARGRVEANTVNGDIIVRTSAPDRGLDSSTVNGSFTVELPAGTNAEVNLSTVNGRINSEFPMTLEGSINPRRIRADIGNGGPTIRARTVNGNIRLRKL